MRAATRRPAARATRRPQPSRASGATGARCRCASIIDFLKANPISTAAKLCHSSLNSSKTNSRASSAVATPVVRSRRGSHDAGRSHEDASRPPRSLGAEGTRPACGARAARIPTWRLSRRTWRRPGAVQAVATSSAAATWPGPLRPSAAAMGGDDSRRNSIDGEAGAEAGGGGGGGGDCVGGARKLSALVTGRVSPSGSREGSIPRRSPNVDDAARRRCCGRVGRASTSDDASPRRRQRRHPLDSQSSQDSLE